MLSLLLCAAVCDQWAVIFTGSRSPWTNYRHTADSFYQYHLLIQNGFDRNKIILMNYDDIATATKNPYQGQIFRTLSHDPDVYPGAENIKYTGKTVTAQNFYNVLLGDTSAGPALASTENDNVFVFFDDHGGSGILGVPSGCGSYIYADDLQKTFEQMAEKKMFKYLFFAITACYAGSVANHLENIPNMYTMTASNDHESSWGSLYDSTLGTCLTSEYSLIKDQFIEQYPDGTLAEMYTYCVDGVKQSHVCEYGDKTLKSLKISDFVGKANKQRKSAPLDGPIIKIKNTRSIIAQAELSNNNELVAAELAAEKRVDQIIDVLKNKFVADADEDFTSYTPIKDWAAYKKVLGAMQQYVKDLGESFYEKTFFFSHLIKYADADKIVETIRSLC